ncbi:MAG: hypothetical protein RIE77_05755 [Phycisphaerales bacterium]|jgi:uncharacterized membrane protein
MDNGKREFEELRNILKKLDRSLDEAQHKRTHGSTPPAPTQAHVPPQPTPAPAVPAAPAVIPDSDQPAEAQPGRLKAKPLRRNRPENSGPSHGWVR